MTTTPNPGQPTDAEREAFEAWVLTQPGGTSHTIARRDFPNAERAGEYVHPSVEFAWRALLATKASAGDAGWLPIETAPKNGHILLAYAPDDVHEDGFVSQGYWMEEDDDGPDNMGHDAGFVDVHFDFFSCARSFGNPKYQSAGTQPTHWMPLPQSPESVQAQQAPSMGREDGTR